MQKKNNAADEELARLRRAQEESQGLQKENQGLRAQIAVKEDECLRVGEENKKIVQQKQLREQHFAAQLREKDVMQRILESRLKQQTELYMHESIKGQAYLEQVQLMADAEHKLQDEVASCAARIKEFQASLARDKKIITEFQSRLEECLRANKQLVRENTDLKARAKTLSDDVCFFFV